MNALSIDSDATGHRYVATETKTSEAMKYVPNDSNNNKAIFYLHYWA